MFTIDSCIGIALQSNSLISPKFVRKKKNPRTRMKIQLTLPAQQNVVTFTYISF